MFGLIVSTAARIGDARPREPERVREVDRVAHDVGLVLQRRRDVDRGIGDDEGPRVGRRLHEEAVAHAPPGAQRARHHRTHQLVGVQAALHQRLDLALERKLHGARGGRLAVRHVLDRAGRRASSAGLLRHRLQARAGRSAPARSVRRPGRRARPTGSPRRTGGPRPSSGDRAASRTAAAAPARRRAAARSAPAAACRAGARCARSGAITVASPEITVLPSWFVQVQSSTRRCFGSSRDRR